MQYKLAQVISTIINPLILLSVVPFILIHKITKDTALSFYWSEVSFIFILIFSVFVLIGVQLKYFSNLDISNRRQRPLLYSFAIFLSLTYLIFLFVYHAPSVLIIGVIALGLGLAVAEIINMRIKISIHVGTITAFATSLVLIYGLLLAPVFLFIPLVSWARIKTKNHTPREVVAGGIVGFLLTIAVYIAFEYIM